MAKRNEKILYGVNSPNIEEIDISETSSESMAEYSKAVVANRAIPDARDGLKPVQRKILWQAHLSKINSPKKKMSTATFVGLVAAFHPHGSGSTSGALVKMSEGWRRNAPLMAIAGNGGSIDGSEAAADRYTKTHQTNATRLMLDRIDRNAVDMIDNYDNTRKMPSVLPAAFPQALTNGTKGIAIGMATAILPHNPVELMEAAKAILVDSEISDEEIAEIIPGPDFPTGGRIVGRGGITEEIASGRGTYKVRGRSRIIDDPENFNNPIIEIYEIPYGSTTDKVTEAVSEYLEKYKHLGIESVDENTDDDVVSILIQCRPGTSRETLEQIEGSLYYNNSSGMQVTLSSNNLMIVDGAPKYLNLREYLEFFIKFRRETLLRIWKHERNEAAEELEAVETVFILRDNLDVIYEIARNASSKAHMEEQLIDRLDCTERQADIISSKPLYRLTTIDVDYFEKNEAHAKQLRAYIDERDQWTSEGYDLTEKMKEDFDTSIEMLKVFGDRKTEIIDEDDVKVVPQIKAVEVVDAKPVTVAVRNDLTMMRIGRQAFENQSPNAKNVVDSVETSTDEYALGITKQGNVVTRLIDTLHHANLDIGLEPLNREISNLPGDDAFIGVVATGDGNRVVTISKRGYIKVMDVDKLMPSTKTRSYLKKVSPASGLKGGEDELVAVVPFSGKMKDLDKMEIVVPVLRKLKSDIKTQEQTIPFAKWASRNDGAGSSGARALNTRDGEFDIDVAKIHIRSFENENEDTE